PVPTAKVSIAKVGVNWVKELKVSSDGKFLQVGLEPKEYDITVTANGFAEIKEREKVPLGIILKKDYVLLTPTEAAASGKSVVVKDESAAAASVAIDSYNAAVEAYNRKDFVTALPMFEASVAGAKDALTKATTDEAKAKNQASLTTMERPYAFVLMEVAKVNEARRSELIATAEPLLAKFYAANPKDQNVLASLVEVAKFKEDKAGLQKYQGELDAILGPRPENAYNQGVELYNASKLAEAKPHFQKAISIDPKFADSYYLLAMCEFAEMNLKGTKANFQKYLELAPSGKHADEVKAMLADPMLKSIK
ncbi:MAG: hypothetical protein LWX11_02365, partial [Firmicutes bacterium]|nr:hypothetical protein [Bacillota bacterium]